MTSQTPDLSASEPIDRAPSQPGTPTYAECLARVVASLTTAGIPDARLEARILLEAATGLGRAQLLAQPDSRLQPGAAIEFTRLETRRLSREPLAYILGYQEFFGRRFEVGPDVLIPRRETELLVEAALAILPGQAPLVADVGTGSGAIALTIAAERPDAIIFALDCSSAALIMAARNAARLGVGESVTFRHSDLLSALAEPVDLIADNLPYVAEADLATAQPELAYEPRSALAGGPDGLDLYRRLFVQAPSYLRAGGALVCEIAADHGARALVLAQAAFPTAQVTIRQDYAGLDRLVVVHLAEDEPR